MSYCNLNSEAKRKCDFIDLNDGWCEFEGDTCPMLNSEQKDDGANQPPTLTSP